MLMKNKTVLIVGIANDYSLAYGVAKKYVSEGAKLILTYPNEAIKKRILPIAQEFGCDQVFELDVTIEDHFTKLVQEFKNKGITLDAMVHSVAFADKEDLKGSFMDTSKAGFHLALDVSCYSLISMCKYFSPFLSDGGSVITLSYYGSQKVVQNYNVMGVAKAALEASVRYLAMDLGIRKIRINAISAGPVKTLAASGISGFRSLLTQVEEKSPLHSLVSSEDVGDMGLYLASSLSRKVTGQVLYVDSGLSILGGF